MRLPASTAKPWMRVQSSCAASDAVSSSAMRIEGPSSSLQQVARAARAVPQVHPQPAGDVGDVVLALAQVRVLDAREDGAELLVGAVHGPRRVDPLACG